MPANNLIRDLVNDLIACDEQPADDRMSEFRQALEHKVTRMKRRGRYSQWVFFAGVLAMMIGTAIVIGAASDERQLRWLGMTGGSIAILGGITIVIGSVGLFLFRGFGYVWARHDLQEASLMELSLQIQRLSERMDTLDRKA